jgi:Ca2+-binding EF-hand superfamily protein
VDIVAESISKLNSFTLELKYDPAILKIFKVKRTSFANWRPRPKEIGESDVWLPILIDNDKGTLTLAVSKTRDDGVSGTGVLATIIFDAVGTGESLISFQNVSLTNVLEKAIQPALREAKAVVRDFGLYDFNKDGVVDILDFIEMKPDGKADVNGDGVIDILDLVADMGPGRDLSIWDVNGDGVVDIQDFIIIRNENGADPDANGDGVVDILDIVYILNSIEASPNMEPKANGLGEIFPNPMNPEAWIPFKLASDSEVAIRIFNSRGQLVRKIDLGYKHLGSYVTRATAAYWDGMNENGEQVPSGIYFYNIKAGNFTATKKMVVMK